MQELPSENSHFDRAFLLPALFGERNDKIHTFCGSMCPILQPIGLVNPFDAIGLSRKKLKSSAVEKMLSPTFAAFI